MYKILSSSFMPFIRFVSFILPLSCYGTALYTTTPPKEMILDPNPVHKKKRDRICRTIGNPPPTLPPVDSILRRGGDGAVCGFIADSVPSEVKVE